MFPAELTAVLSNLLTNAVKAAEIGGTIRARGKRQNGAARLVIENTGSRVDIRRAARWFEPFESTTTEIDPVLGQGMGLGLPITRRVLDEYGALIKFIKPSKGYSTAIEIVFAEE
jgi:signal transduction histidine kinase